MTDIQATAGDDFRGDQQRPPAPGSRRPTNQQPSLSDVNSSVPQPFCPERPTPTRWWVRMLDGERRWGSIDVSPPRYGVTRYRLVVFPPGTDTQERRLLRVWRAWPTWGALLWLASQIVLGAFVTPIAALTVSTVGYLGAGMILFGRVAELRSRVRTMTVVRIAGYADPRSAAKFAELKELVATLCQADAEHDQGWWSPADHEAIWWQVYDRVGDPKP